MAGNLVKKGNTWHVRMAIPNDVQAAFGHRRILTRSLKTSSKKQADLLKAAHLLEWKELIRKARKGLPLPDDWKDQIIDVSEVINDDIRKHILSLVGQGTYTPPDSGEPDPAWLEHPELVEALAYLNSDERTLEEKIEYRRELGKVFIESTARIFQNKFQDRTPSEDAQLAAAIESPHSFTTKHPITSDSIEKWGDYLNTHLDNQKTIVSHISRVRRIAKFLSSHELDLSFESIHHFITDLQLSNKTAKSYLWSGRDLWDWATLYDNNFKKRQKDQPNPFKGHKLPKNRAAKGDTWSAFKKQDIELLYTKAHEQEKFELAKLIAIAAYTGMRLEEIGRIKPSDITYKDKMPYSLNIPQAKTPAGIREIPIHSEISELFSLLAAAPKNGYLLLGKPNKFGNRLDYLSKQFGRLKKKANFSDSYVFHSIRKTTATELQQSGADILIVPAILGHETGTVTYDIYAKGPSMIQMQEAVKKLSFDFSKSPTQDQPKTHRTNNS